MTDRNDMSNEDPCLHFEAKLVPDLRTKIKKRLIAAICDLKQPWKDFIIMGEVKIRSFIASLPVWSFM